MLPPASRARFRPGSANQRSHSSASPSSGSRASASASRAEQAARGLRRADDDQRHRRVDQPLGLQPAPRAAALPQRGVKAFALQIDHLLRRIDLERELSG